MKNRLISLVPYAAVLALSFYLLPCLIKDTGAAMLLMLCVIPLITFICSILYGVRHGFDLLLAIAVAALFSPTIFLYYNSSAWVYIIAYSAIAVAGNGIGKSFYKKR